MAASTIVVMGVSGSGKTTVARAVARASGAVMIDADDLHPPSNLLRLASGVPLDDAAREPWLDLVVAAIGARSGPARPAIGARSGPARPVIEASRGSARPATEARSGSARPAAEASRGSARPAAEASRGSARPVVVACSALRRAYRDRLREAGPLRFVFLDVPQPELRRRLSRRRGHYMPSDLLADQLAVLERPGPDEPDVEVLDGTASLDDLVAAILADPTPAGAGLDLP